LTLAAPSRQLGGHRIRRAVDLCSKSASRSVSRAEVAGSPEASVHKTSQCAADHPVQGGALCRRLAEHADCRIVQRSYQQLGRAWDRSWHDGIGMVGHGAPSFGPVPRLRV
jgi:hypothetical protein